MTFFLLYSYHDNNWVSIRNYSHDNRHLNFRFPSRSFTQHIPLMHNKLFPSVLRLASVPFHCHLLLTQTHSQQVCSSSFYLHLLPNALPSNRSHKYPSSSALHQLEPARKALSLCLKLKVVSHRFSP